MLKTAIDAKLPIIAVSTRDTLNLPEVLAHVSKKTPVKIALDTAIKFTEDGLHYVVNPSGSKIQVDWPNLYERAVKHHATLIVVNIPTVDDVMFKCGEVPVPKPLVEQFLMAVTEDKAAAQKLMTALGGCTLKEVAELCRLTMARDQSLTTAGLMTTRKEFFTGSQGLTLVDSAQPYYEPPSFLTHWLIREKPFFFSAPDARMMPRGLLFDGKPGLGKTAGAKYIAETLGVPLYRLDIATTKNKFVGQSEENLQINLSRADQEEPAVILLDEVEKVLAQGTHYDSGTSTGMLGQMLWWLAERQSRTLVIMTTNNRKALPPELYRERRIDEVMVFQGLNEDQAVPFCIEVAKTFKHWKGNKEKAAKWATQEAFKNAFDTNPATVSQAKLTQLTTEYLKLNPKS